jgi:hypothetical protein
MRIDMVAPAVSPQLEPKRFDKAAEIGEPDIPPLSLGKSTP